MRIMVHFACLVASLFCTIAGVTAFIITGNAWAVVAAGMAVLVGVREMQHEVDPRVRLGESLEVALDAADGAEVTVTSYQYDPNRHD